MKVILKQHAETSMKLSNDDFEVIVDRPLEKGGNGKGLMGGQYMLTGIAGCFSSNLFAAAEGRGLTIDGLEIEVRASISEDKPQRFSDVTLDVSYNSVSDETIFSKIVRIAEKACIAINTVKHGMKVDVVTN